jgi:hypothetical protein
MKKRILFSFVTMCFCMAFVSVSMAGNLEMPKGPVILTVSGKIAHTNVDSKAEFDREMLMALGMKTIKTMTPWYDHAVVFEGPLGSDLLEKLGVTSGMMKVRALNDYVADVPVNFLQGTGAILAMKADGQTMRVRDKGPLFIIFPFDDRPELKNDSYYVRSVWQIKSIHFE